LHDEFMAAHAAARITPGRRTRGNVACRDIGVRLARAQLSAMKSYAARRRTDRREGRFHGLPTHDPVSTPDFLQLMLAEQRHSAVQFEGINSSLAGILTQLRANVSPPFPGTLIRRTVYANVSQVTTALPRARRAIVGPPAASSDVGSSDVGSSDIDDGADDDIDVDDDEGGVGLEDEEEAEGEAATGSEGAEEAEA